MKYDDLDENHTSIQIMMNHTEWSDKVKLRRMTTPCDGYMRISEHFSAQDARGLISSARIEARSQKQEHMY